MNNYLNAVKKKTRELQDKSSRTYAAIVGNARAFYEGYVQGTEDLLRAIEDVAEDETLYKENDYE